MWVNVCKSSSNAHNQIRNGVHNGTTVYHRLTVQPPTPPHPIHALNKIARPPSPGPAAILSILIWQVNTLQQPSRWQLTVSIHIQTEATVCHHLDRHLSAAKTAMYKHLLCVNHHPPPTANARTIWMERSSRPKNQHKKVIITVNIIAKLYYTDRQTRCPAMYAVIDGITPIANSLPPSWPLRHPSSSWNAILTCKRSDKNVPNRDTEPSFRRKKPAATHYFVARKSKHDE